MFNFWLEGGEKKKKKVELERKKKVEALNSFLLAMLHTHELKQWIIPAFHPRRHPVEQ